MKYRNGYKYQLAETMTLQTDIKGFTVDSDAGRISLNSLGVLTIQEGYASDGASGPTIDRKENLRAGFGHDALYQLMRENKLPFDLWSQADQNYGKWLAIGGAWPITVRINVYGLGLMKGKYAQPQNRKKVYTV